MSEEEWSEADWALRNAQIYRLALTLLKDENQAEDVVQDAWLGVVSHQIKQKGAALGSYLNASVVNSVRKIWRNAASKTWKEEAGAHQEATTALVEDLDSSECAVLLREGVGRLGEPYRSAISLHFFEGMSSIRIAQHLGLNPATVRSHLKRGIERLRKQLDGTHGRSQWTAGLLVMLKKETGWTPSASEPTIATSLETAGLSATASAFVVLTTVALALTPLIFSGDRVNAQNSRPALQGSAATNKADVAGIQSPQEAIQNSRGALASRAATPVSVEPLATRGLSADVLELNVLERERGVPASGFTVVELPKGVLPHSGGLRPEAILAAGASSPVLIASDGSGGLRELWIGDGPYCWQVVEIRDPADHADARQFVDIERGAALDVHYEGEFDFLGTELRISQSGSTEFTLIMPINQFPIHLSGLPLGAIDVAVCPVGEPRLVANGKDLFIINPSLQPLSHNSLVLEASRSTQLFLEILDPQHFNPPVEIELELHINQPVTSERGVLSIFPTSFDEYARMPSAIRRELTFDKDALRSEFHFSMALPKGRYKIGIRPLLHFVEINVSADGIYVLETDAAELVVVELGDSFVGTVGVPERLLFTRMIDEDHAPLQIEASIDWSLSTCTTYLVPGAYRVTPVLERALLHNVKSMMLTVRRGVPLQIPLEWEGQGFESPPLGVRLNFSFQGTSVPVDCPDLSLIGVDHDGSQIPVESLLHPYLLGPGRYPAFPSFDDSPEDKETPWTFEVRVTEPGAYVLAPITIPPYLPTLPKLIHVAPGEFQIVTIDLARP